MMKKLYTLLFVLFAGSLTAQIDRTQMPKPGPAPEINLKDPQRFELKNGLKILVVENHKLPRVSVQLRIDNPPILEGDKAGVSSLAGSLMGKGSKSISKDDFNEEVDFLGARINFSSQSAFASSLSKYFPRILELMADAAINPNFTQEEFDKEKDKLLTGLKTQEKDVKAISSRVQSALAYGQNHPYGEFVTEQTVNNVSLADAKQFYSNYFVPANAYLVVIGDVTPVQIQKLVEEYFTPWTRAIPPSFQFSKPRDVQYSQISFVDVPNAVQSEISVQNLVDLKMKDPNYLSAIMANQILGGGGDGRLHLNLREDKGYTYDSSSRLGNDKHAPARFRAGASVRNMVTDSSIVEILKEIDKIRDTPVTAEELKNAKAKYVGSFVMALEAPVTIARYALNIETEGLPKDFYKTYLEKINAITIADVQNAAQKYFSSDNTRIVVIAKGSEVLENLEKISVNGKTIPVKYFDKYAAETEKPNYEANMPEGVGINDVMNKYINAIGGKTELESVTSYMLIAEAEMQGMKLNLEMKKTSKNQFMKDMKVMGNSMSKQVLNDGSGYVVMQGQRKDMDETELKKVREESAPFPELQYLNGGISLEGMEGVDGKKAYKVKVSEEKTLYYDVETGLKVKEVAKSEMMGQQVTSTIIYSDYREVQGIMFPYSIAQTVGPQSFEFIVSEIKINEGVSDADFE
jgi:zinc protease